MRRLKWGRSPGGRVGRPLLAIALLTALTACEGPRREVPTLPSGIEMPATFRAADERSDAPLARWWEAFGSPELNALVETALVENRDLTQAWARLDQGARDHPHRARGGPAAHRR